LNSVIQELISNKVLLVTLLVWILAQTIKVIIGVINQKKFDFKWFIGTGGMPSSHAAGVTALATTCGIHLGFDSVTFALAAVFAMVTMFDAQGVRWATGQQAQILNKILDDIYWRGKVEPQYLKELVGHTPVQVFAGSLLGLIVSIFLYYKL